MIQKPHIRNLLYALWGTSSSAMSLNTRLNSTTCATFIGGTLSTFLYGVTCAQVMYYMRRYPMDHTRLWFLVASLWLLDTARTTIWVLYIWAWNVTYHSDILGLLTYGRDFLADVFLEGLTILIVQMYFIHCIWRVVQHRKYQLLLTMTMGLMCLASFGLSICHYETCVP